MNLEQLIARFRVDSTDSAQGHLFEDDWIIDWLNEAETEAAIRGRLLYECAAPAICEIVTLPDVRAYKLHSSVYEIVSIRYRADGEARSRSMDLTSREELDRDRCHWRDDAPGAPRFAMQDDVGLFLHPTPDRPGKVFIEGYRLPIKPMANDNDKPEINAAHHRFLVYWALHRGFSRPDADTFDPNRAKTAEQEFTRYFGLRPDSDLRRSARIDTPHTTKAFWP